MRGSSGWPGLPSVESHRSELPWSYTVHTSALSWRPNRWASPTLGPPGTSTFTSAAHGAFVSARSLE